MKENGERVFQINFNVWILIPEFLELEIVENENRIPCNITLVC